VTGFEVLHRSEPTPSLLWSSVHSIPMLGVYSAAVEQLNLCSGQFARFASPFDPNCLLSDGASATDTTRYPSKHLHTRHVSDVCWFYLQLHLGTVGSSTVLGDYIKSYPTVGWLAPNGCLAKVPLSMGCADEPSIATAVGTDFGRIWVFGSRLCR